MRSAEPDDTTTLIPHGGAAPGDMHLIADVHCREGDIVRWLSRGRRRRRCALVASLIGKHAEIVGVLVEEHERRRDESLNDAADG